MHWSSAEISAWFPLLLQLLLLLFQFQPELTVLTLPQIRALVSECEWVSE